MPAGRVAMRRVREVLRLGFAGISKHEIARRSGLAASTVRETMARFKATGLNWPLPDSVTDSELEAKLYKNAGTRQGHRRHAEPDWVCIHRELRRKHVTLSILWDEYIEQHPDGYRYSRFCELYRAWEGTLSVTMRQSHAGGDKPPRPGRHHVGIPGAIKSECLGGFIGISTWALGQLRLQPHAPHLRCSDPL